VSFSDPIGHSRTEAAPPPPPDPKADAAGRKLLDDALAAKGGEAKLRAIKSIDMQAKGAISGQAQNGQTQSMDVTIQRRFAPPDKIRVDVEIKAPAGNVQIAYAVVAGAGWQQSPQGVADIPADQLAQLGQQLWTDPELVLLRHKDKGVEVRALPDQKVDGVDYSLVNLTSADKKNTVTLFIDKKTRLVKQLAYPDQGGVTFDLFDDYKDVSGIKVAHHRVNKNDLEMIDLTLTKVQLNAKIGDDAFTRPTGPSAGPKPPAGGATP
jgi:hypothetical protein